LFFEAKFEKQVAIAQDDPAVQPYVFQAQVRFLGLHVISNKYLLESNKHE